MPLMAMELKQDYFILFHIFSHTDRIRKYCKLQPMPRGHYTAKGSRSIIIPPDTSPLQAPTRPILETEHLISQSHYEQR